MSSTRWISAFLALIGAGAAQAQTVKIGIVNSYSGFLAQPGDQMQKAFDLYVKLHEKDLPPGVKLEIIKRDDGAQPDIGKRVAQELVTRDHVQMLLGVVSSPVATAVGPMTAEAKTPFIITNAAGVSIPRLSPYIVRTSFTQWHSAYPMGKWAAEQGLKTGYSAVSDFIPGHDAEDAFKKGFTDGGGKMLGSVRFPTNSPDFAPFVQRIKDAKPDVALLWVPSGSQATSIMKVAQDLGLPAAGVKVVSTQDLLPEEEMLNMGEAGDGLVTAGTYDINSTAPANVAFLKAWNDEYKGKSTPDYMSVDAWDGMSAVFDVIKQTKGKFTADEAMTILSHWKTDSSPRGPISIHPATRDIVQNVYIRRAQMKDGKLVNVLLATIKDVKDPWKEFNPAK